MKIVEVNTYTVRPRWGFVEIVTDEGLTGWGEPVLEGHCATVLACVQEMKPYLIGKDPMRIEDFSHVTQVESTRLIVSLLVQDCGIAFLYQAAVRRELAEGTLVQIPLADFSMEHDFVFLWNRTSAFSSEYAHICHALSTL